MAGRWMVKVLAVNGETVHLETFRTRRGARSFARQMRSPLLDIDLADGRDRRPAERLHQHVEPRDLLDDIAAGRWPR